MTDELGAGFGIGVLVTAIIIIVGAASCSQGKMDAKYQLDKVLSNQEVHEELVMWQVRATEWKARACTLDPEWKGCQ